MCYEKGGIADPILRIKPSDYNGQESDSFSLYCSATSNPSPRYSWTRANNAQLPSSASVMPDGSLKFISAATYDSGDSK